MAANPDTYNANDDSNSDVSELDPKALNGASAPDAWVPQLGYAEEPESPLTADTFPSKSGGLPAWLNPEHVLKADNVMCGQCNQPMTLLLQLYTPEDNPPEAFHRMVYVFCCRNGACVNKEWQKSLKVFRSQLPRNNPYYPPPSDEEDDEEETQEESFEPKKFTPPRLCVICGLEAPKCCGQCRQVHYCSREHQVVDWTRCRHKDFCNKTTSESDQNSVVRLRQSHVFAEKEIVSEPESGDAATASQTADMNVTVEPTESGDTSEISMNEDKYENTKVEVDETFLRFQKRINRHPDQILRYDRVEYGMPDCDPLWVQDDDKPTHVPDCERCGAPRTYEMQILSTILNFLDVSHVEKDSLDWGSLYIYSCKNNCALGNDVFGDEFIWKQDFSTKGMKLEPKQGEFASTSSK